MTLMQMILKVLNNKKMASNYTIDRYSNSIVIPPYIYICQTIG